MTQQESNPALLPCPFCQGAATAKLIPETNGDWHHVDVTHIDGCFYKPKAERLLLNTKSLAAWNTRAALAATPAAKAEVLPAGWVPCTITYEGQYPEDVAYGPKIMMDRLKNWLGRYFALKAEVQAEQVADDSINRAFARIMELTPAQMAERLKQYEGNAFANTLRHLAEPVAWDGQLPGSLQRALNELRIDGKPNAVSSLEFEVRHVFEGMHTSLATVRRMYRTASDRLEAIEGSQPDPLTAPQAQPADALVAERIDDLYIALEVCAAELFAQCGHQGRAMKYVEQARKTLAAEQCIRAAMAAAQEGGNVAKGAAPVATQGEQLDAKDGESAHQTQDQSND